MKLDISWKAMATVLVSVAIIYGNDYAVTLTDGYAPIPQAQELVVTASCTTDSDCEGVGDGPVAGNMEEPQVGHAVFRF